MDLQNIHGKWSWKEKFLQKSFVEKEELILSDLHFSRNTKSVNGLQWRVLLIYNKQNYFERDFNRMYIRYNQRVLTRIPTWYQYFKSWVWFEIMYQIAGIW